MKDALEDIKNELLELKFDVDSIRNILLDGCN